MKPTSTMKLRPGQTGICGPAEASGQNLRQQGHQHQHQQPPTPTSPPSSPPSPMQPPEWHTAPSPHSTPPVGEHIEETGQAGPCLLKVVSATERERPNRECIVVVVTCPCQENCADAHTCAHWSVLESASPAWTRRVYVDAPGQRHGQWPVSGTADPRVVKQGKSSRGSVDTTRQSSDPQRVRMFSGERPVGAAKGKQLSTKASCQTPPPHTHTGSGGHGPLTPTPPPPPGHWHRCGG